MAGTCRYSLLIFSPIHAIDKIQYLTGIHVGFTGNNIYMKERKKESIFSFSQPEGRRPSGKALGGELSSTTCSRTAVIKNVFVLLRVFVWEGDMTKFDALPVPEGPEFKFRLLSRIFLSTFNNSMWTRRLIDWVSDLQTVLKLTLRATQVTPPFINHRQIDRFFEIPAARVDMFERPARCGTNKIYCLQGLNR